MDGDQGSRSQMVGNLEELRARGQAVIESLFSIQLETLLEVQKRLSAERPSPEGLPRPFPGHRRPLPGVGLPGDGPGPDHRLGQDRFSFCHPAGEGGVGPDQYQKHPLLDLFGDDPKSRRPLEQKQAWIKEKLAARSPPRSADSWQGFAERLPHRC